MSNWGIFEIVQRGGPIMWFILLASVLGIGVFAERLVFYHRCAVPLGEFLKGIALLVREGRMEEALDRCDEVYGPSVKVIQTALLKRQLPRDELREVLQEVAQLQVPRLEANLVILSTVAHVSPLLGLLGTVTGMITAFQSMTMGGGGAPMNELAGGIWEALVTTAGGLSVAIPVYVAYNYLATRCGQLVSDMERAGIEMVLLLKEGGVTGKPAVAAPEGVKRETAKP